MCACDFISRAAAAGRSVHHFASGKYLHNYWMAVQCSEEATGKLNNHWTNARLRTGRPAYLHLRDKGHSLEEDDVHIYRTDGLKEDRRRPFTAK